MSEGTGGVADAALGVSEHQLNRYAGFAFIAIALLGPILGVFFGKGFVLAFGDGVLLAVGDGVRQGAYSLPLAIFGIAPLVVRITSPRDYYGGVALAALALFALWASSDLPGLRGFAFGPGTAPRMFAYVLLALGATISLVGVLTQGEPLEKYTFAGPLGASLLLLVLIPLNIFSVRISHLLPNIAADVVFAAVTGVTVVVLSIVLMRIAPRGPLLITAATIVFGVTVRPLGLVIASFISLVVSAYATDEMRWVETLICAAVLTAFCSLLFPYGLNLPLQLWPRF